MAVKTDDINQQYQQYLGRNASDSEIADFQRFQNTGYIDLTAQDLGRIIQGTPEYQKQQLNTFGQQYSGQLGASDTRILGLAQNDIQGQFASMGRSGGTSSYLNAFAQAAANLAMSRQQQLANFYGQGYQGIMNTQVGQGQSTLGGGLNSQATGIQRGWALSDYTRMQNDYNNAMKAQQSRNLMGQITNAGVGLVGGLLGAAGGGAIGGYFGPQVAKGALGMNQSSGGPYSSMGGSQMGLFGGSGQGYASFGGYSGFTPYSGGMRND